MVNIRCFASQMLSFAGEKDPAAPIVVQSDPVLPLIDERFLLLWKSRRRSSVWATAKPSGDKLSVPSRRIHPDSYS